MSFSLEITTHLLSKLFSGGWGMNNKNTHFAIIIQLQFSQRKRICRYIFIQTGLLWYFHLFPSCLDNQTQIVGKKKKKVKNLLLFISPFWLLQGPLFIVCFGIYNSFSSLHVCLLASASSGHVTFTQCTMSLTGGRPSAGSLFESSRNLCLELWTESEKSPRPAFLVGTQIPSPTPNAKLIP